MLAPWKKSYDHPRQHIKKQRHYFANKCPSSQGYFFFPVVMYGCENWTVKKAEIWRSDAFELWCWIRLLRDPWTAAYQAPPSMALTRRTLVGKVMSLFLNMLSRLVITFLPRSKCLLISWMQLGIYKLPIGNLFRYKIFSESKRALKTVKEIWKLYD